MTLTRENNYFEDFQLGDRFEHRRGRTATDLDNQLLSLLTMNTAQTHFNHANMQAYMDGAFVKPLLNACVVLAICVGLTSQDMSENSLEDLGYDDLALPKPVYSGDTLYAVSEVLQVIGSAKRADAGIVEYLIEARNQRQELVLTVRRTVLVKRRNAWLDKDRLSVESIYLALERALAEARPALSGIGPGSVVERRQSRTT